MSHFLCCQASDGGSASVKRAIGELAPSGAPRERNCRHTYHGAMRAFASSVFAIFFAKCESWMRSQNEWVFLLFAPRRTCAKVGVDLIPMHAKNVFRRVIFSGLVRGGDQVAVVELLIKELFVYSRTLIRLLSKKSQESSYSL